ncbi:glycosyltransferase involved in cell wall biosynthesis [Spinactinospora alkalitolerans]|uniref:Glycosyltransferase involved in cell wall biosynthesis n=1 Tax=Spinactinospora alkalitolerans TaxID=687207 RepID=A0A852TYC2_9ACTN|nr:glycosyltransferase [Spinactinospora alkalitolerans]NYE49546.1 glycosyltransferase involved in cell wall biosynthesis [Spinactinospora alkalitolerans]
MRIAYVCADPGVPVFGSKGASIHVQEVLRRLLARGARVELFCMRTGGPAPADLAGVAVHEAAPARAEDTGRRERMTMRAATALEGLLRRAAPFDLVYERYALWGGFGAEWAHASGVPGVLEVNAPLIEEQAAHRGLVHRRAAEANLTRTLAVAPTVVCVSGPVAAWARERGAAAERVHVVPNGVDTDRFRPAPAEPAGPFTVGFSGSLKSWHGVHALLDACAPLPDDTRLLLVGDGPEGGALRRRAAEGRLAGRVEFTGALPADRVPAQLRRMHVAAAPYHPGAGRYFSPLKVYEYLAAGLPVVAGDIGQNAEVVAPGRNGVLVPPGDAGALAGALADLRGDPATRTRMRAAARRTALGHTWEATVTRILAAAGVPAEAHP